MVRHPLHAEGERGSLYVTTRLLPEGVREGLQMGMPENQDEGPSGLDYASSTVTLLSPPPNQCQCFPHDPFPSRVLYLNCITCICILNLVSTECGMLPKATLEWLSISVPFRKAGSTQTVPFQLPFSNTTLCLCTNTINNISATCILTCNKRQSTIQKDHAEFVCVCKESNLNYRPPLLRCLR